jgi:hypothetical protein
VARTVSYRLRRLPDAPLPKLLGVVARRSGKDVVVNWRTDRDVKASSFAVAAARHRDDDVYELGAFADARGSDRRFHARITNARDARFVRIFTQVKGRRSGATKTVRVRG